MKKNCYVISSDGFVCRLTAAGVYQWKAWSEGEWEDLKESDMRDWINTVENPMAVFHCPLMLAEWCAFYKHDSLKSMCLEVGW